MEQVTAKASRSGSRTNCYTASKLAGDKAQPSFATFPQVKATHKVHWGFPQVGDCRIWLCGQQEAELSFW